VAVLIVVAVAVAMLWTVVFGLRVTASVRSPTNVAFWEVDADYYACLSGQLKGAVRSGDVVWTSYATPYAPFWFRTLWKVTAAYTPVTVDPRGVTRLYLAAAPHGEGCLGTRLEIVHPDGTVSFGHGYVALPLLKKWRALGSPPLP